MRRSCDLLTEDHFLLYLLIGLLISTTHIDTHAHIVLHILHQTTESLHTPSTLFIASILVGLRYLRCETRHHSIKTSRYCNPPAPIEWLPSKPFTYVPNHYCCYSMRKENRFSTSTQLKALSLLLLSSFKASLKGNGPQPKPSPCHQ